MNWNLLGQVNFGTGNLSYLDYDHGPPVNITSSLSKWCLGKRCEFFFFLQSLKCAILEPPIKGLTWSSFLFQLCSPGVSDGEESKTVQETRVPSLGQEDPLEKWWLPTSVFLPGKFHRQRSLVGYSP